MTRRNGASADVESRVESLRQAAAAERRLQQDVRQVLVNELVAALSQAIAENRAFRQAQLTVWCKRRWNLDEFTSLLDRTADWLDTRPKYWDDRPVPEGQCWVFDCGDGLHVPVRDDPSLRGRHVNHSEYVLAEARRLGIPASEVAP